MCVGVGWSVSQHENIWSLLGKYPDQTNLSQTIIWTTTTTSRLISQGGETGDGEEEIISVYTSSKLPGMT